MAVRQVRQTGRGAISNATCALDKATYTNMPKVIQSTGELIEQTAETIALETKKVGKTIVEAQGDARGHTK